MAESTVSDEQTSAIANETALDISLLKEIGQKALVDALNSVNGAKTLVLDASLAGPLGLVIEVSLLKHHGVDKMFWLEPGPLTASTPNIVYLCRPHIKNVKILADQIKRHGKESEKYNYTLLLVPRLSTLVTRILEEEGVLGDVTISSYNLQFIPVAEDVISLENDNAFKEIWVDGDETVVFDSAQALGTLQKLYGLFPRIVGKGDCAARLTKLLTRLKQPSDSPTPDRLLNLSDKIDSLIVLDRRVDLVTPLLTQLTYEGLIDELIGIKNSHVELPASLVNPPPPISSSNSAPSTSSPTSSMPVTSLKKEGKKKYHLTTATDPLLAELRDVNFASVGKKLNKVAHRLDEDYKGRLKAKTVAQLRDFVGKLGGLQNEHQSLRLHTGLSELLMPMTRTEQFGKVLEIQQSQVFRFQAVIQVSMTFVRFKDLLASFEVPKQIAGIEELIAQGADMQTILRLLCLASITAGGIKSKVLENIKREILQSYGYHYLPLLLSLAAPPLSILLPNPLAPSATAFKYPFPALRKSLRLLIDDSPEAIDEVENDISFVYSGYAPISVRLVQCVAQKGGVISNPAIVKEKGGNEEGSGKRIAGKVQAHPIVGWKGFEDVLASLPGDTTDIVQKGANADSRVPSLGSLLIPHDQSTTTVVFFLGGCTYTEIAALRWVARQNRGRNFLIATTGIISGNSLVDSISGLSKSNNPKEAGI